jgi:topoisomerase-4 subunit A
MEDRGNFIGEFQTVDRIIVFYESGKVSIYKPDLTLHFDEGMCHMDKHDEERVYTVVYYDLNHKYYYIKRFLADINGKPQSYLPEDMKCEFVLISPEKFPKFRVSFGGKNKNREDEIVDVGSFIAVKGIKAKGKRLSNYEIRKVEELEPDKRDEENDPSGGTKNEDQDPPAESKETDQDFELIEDEEVEQADNTKEESAEKPNIKNLSDDNRINGEQMSLDW